MKKLMKITKTLSISIILLLMISTLITLPNSSAQSTTPIVRTIYFLPSDREPRPNINEELDKLIRKVQQAYADQMEVHGFDRKTFRFETDTTGKAVVHHIVGRFATRYYRNQPDLFSGAHEEINERFDTSKNFYITVIDISNRPADPGVPGCGQATAQGSTGGMVLIPASGQCLSDGFDVWLTTHELGHTFGLMHDSLRTDGTWIPTSYTDDSMITSFCAAEWLDVHRAFTPGQPSLNKNKPSEIKMLRPSFASSPNAIRLRFELADPDGLHQAQLLHVHDMLGYQSLNGTNGNVEFITTELTPEMNRVSLQIIDVSGNLTNSEVFSIDIKGLLPPAKAISIPDPNLAAAVRQEIGDITTHTISNLNYLDLRGIVRPGRDNLGITNLTGLEHAYNIRSLHLDNYQNNVGKYVNPNTISDFSPLKGLLKLGTLSLGNTFLTDISALANLTQLRSLNLGGNAITDISPLARLTQLQSLALSSLNLSDISTLASLTQLRYLYLSQNSVTDISALADLTQLRRLNLSQNSVTDVSPLASLTQLQRLHLNRNSVTDISALAGLTQLINLSLGNNTIADVSPLVELQELTQLDLRGNPLSFDSIHIHIPAMQANGIEVKFVNRAHPALLKISGDKQDGVAGETLSKPFIVEAMDARGQPIRGKPVMFNVIAGAGSFKATTVKTNAKGRAQATFTLGGNPGKHTVHVSAQGIRSSVTFTAHAIGQTEAPSEVVIHVDPDQLPPMYWTDHDWTLSRLVGGEVESGIIKHPELINDFVVNSSNNRIYWSEFSKGITKLKRANLDGSGVKGLATLPNVFIARLSIDPQRKKLYWISVRAAEGTGTPNTNIMNVMQSNLNGKHIKKIGTLDVGDITNVRDIKIDVLGKKLYIMVTKPKGSFILSTDLNFKNRQQIANNLGLAAGMVISGDKIYWIEADVQVDAPKIKMANLNGSNIKVLMRAYPQHLAIDATGKKLYWLSGTGEVWRSNLNGKNRQKVASGICAETGGSCEQFFVGSSDTVAAAPVNMDASPPPKATHLLPNYPNPFNPETWIPYQLAAPADIGIAIYAINGKLVRTLGLGHQPAGIYDSRSRAAYWDGRNAQGEPVASGVYFYTLSAGEFTATRKMLIRK